MPITAYLIINFNVQAGIQNQEKTSTSKVTIYLNQPAYEIKVKDSKNQESTIIETQDNNIIVVWMYIIYYFCRIFGLFDLEISINRNQKSSSPGFQNFEKI